MKDETREGETRGRGDTEIKPNSFRRSVASASDLSTAASPRPPHRPSRRFGQNFLVDERVIDRLLGALAPNRDETILEIGPGRGALTQRLVTRAGRVVAVEFDRHLVPHLREQFRSQHNFKLVHADALVTAFCSEIAPAQSARVVANLPYNIGTAILQHLLEQRACLTEMVLMLQREVVERITAAPGSTERGYLTVLVEAYCEAEKLFDVAPGSFRPVPKVWSSVARLTVRPRPAVEVTEEKLLWRIVSAGFAQRRKTILNNLRNASEPLQQLIKRRGGASVVLCDAKIEIQRRAETLTVSEWSRIARLLG